MEEELSFKNLLKMNYGNINKKKNNFYAVPLAFW